MSGETDLAKLLAGLHPSLDDLEYAFATVPDGQKPPEGIEPLGTFREAEGMTLIAPVAAFVALGFSGDRHPRRARSLRG